MGIRRLVGGHVRVGRSGGPFYKVRSKDERDQTAVSCVMGHEWWDPPSCLSSETDGPVSRGRVRPTAVIGDR